MLDCTSNPAVGRHSIFNNTGRIFNSHLTQPNLSLPPSFPTRHVSSFRRRFPFSPSIVLYGSREVVSIGIERWTILHGREGEPRTPLPFSPSCLGGIANLAGRQHVVARRTRSRRLFSYLSGSAEFISLANNTRRNGRRRTTGGPTKNKPRVFYRATACRYASRFANSRPPR